MHNLIAIEASSAPGGGTIVEATLDGRAEVPSSGPHQLEPFLLLMGRRLSLHGVGDVGFHHLGFGRLVYRWLATDLGDPIADGTAENLHLASDIGKLLDGEPHVSLQHGLMDEEPNLVLVVVTSDLDGLVPELADALVEKHLQAHLVI